MTIHPHCHPLSSRRWDLFVLESPLVTHLKTRLNQFSHLVVNLFGNLMTKRG